MKKERPGLITIQKFIYLLDDFHYNEFITHLSSVNATLPLKLVTTIRHKLPAFESHEGLCKSVYGSFGKGPKQNFNQLASYTFRLSGALAQNYPGYLGHNIFKIQRLVNEGKGTEANFLADILLDIAERTNNFQCQVFVLNFLTRQAFITKNTAAGIKLDARLSEALNSEKILVDIQIFTRKTLAGVNLKKSELENVKDHLLGFANHNSPAIRILARHSFLLILYQFDPHAFDQPEIREMASQLQKDLNNQAHVVFPYLHNLRGSLFFADLSL